MPRSRKLPTRDELRIWRDFIETGEALRNLLGSRLHADTGLSMADYAVLLALSETTGNRARSSDLAALIGWERSRLSHHLARMERRELIRREDCPTDNRGAEVVLTATGKRAFQAATVPHLSTVRELFVEALTAEQLTAAGEVAAALRVHLADLAQPAHGARPEVTRRSG